MSSGPWRAATRAAWDGTKAPKMPPPQESPEGLTCQPCWERAKKKVTAARVVAGTPMCGDCFSGKSPLREEIAEQRQAMRAAISGSPARRRAARKKGWEDPVKVATYQRRYYAAHREERLAYQRRYNLLQRAKA